MSPWGGGSSGVSDAPGPGGAGDGFNAQSSLERVGIPICRGAASAAARETGGVWAGVYDNAAKSYPAQARFSVSNTGAGYRSHLIGNFAPNEHRDIYVAPAGQSGVRALWVDRIYLVPAR